MLIQEGMNAIIGFFGILVSGLKSITYPLTNLNGFDFIVGPMVFIALLAFAKKVIGVGSDTVSPGTGESVKRHKADRAVGNLPGVGKVGIKD